MRVSLSTAADDDLSAIFDFTLSRWGEEQARAYLAGLHARLDELATGVAIARRVPGRDALVRLGYRSHILFVTITGVEVFVVRILHASMDAARHLP